ncbi:MAG: hypothetical protein AB7F96_10545 [Beijerinckiaceae bacterium]
MTKILIATPSYDGTVRKEYMQTIMQVSDYCRQNGFGWDIVLEMATVLHTLRSVMASKALADPESTHILFVDADMAFTVGAFAKMLKSGHDVVGCASPLRTIPLHHEVPTAGISYRQSLSAAVPYAVNMPSGLEKLEVINGICEVGTIGTGILLISTAALKTMRDRGKIETYKTKFPYDQYYGEPKYWAFFEHIKVDGDILGEDISFCWRWKKDCGGKIYAVVDEEIGHIGPMPVLGRYLDKIKTGKL